MARIISYYIPSSYRPNPRWTPPENRGKVLQFRTPLAAKPEPSAAPSPAPVATPQPAGIPSFRSIFKGF